MYALICLVYQQLLLSIVEKITPRFNARSIMVPFSLILTIRLFVKCSLDEVKVNGPHVDSLLKLRPLKPAATA